MKIGKATVPRSAICTSDEHTIVVRGADLVQDPNSRPAVSDAPRMTDPQPRIPAATASCHRFCEAGIAIVPEGRRLFTSMTVQDNLDLGSYTAAAKRKRSQTLAQVLALFPVLGEKLRSPAGSLSGGQQQMVAIGRALIACPTLLLLDEPSLGLAPAIVYDMFRAIRAINAQGTSILLVEQNVVMAMQLAHRAYVMEEGRIVATGPADELMGRPEIRKAYLGLEAQ